MAVIGPSNSGSLRTRATLQMSIETRTNHLHRATHTIAIATILVNWNNVADTLECLDSLLAAVPLPERVVLVDNGSADDSVDQFRAWASGSGQSFEILQLGERSSSASRAPWLSIIKTGRNLGFSGGNNVGLALLEAESVM